MKKFLLSIWEVFNNFNSQLVYAIKSFLHDYIPYNDPPYLASLMPRFIQIGFYAFLLIIIFAFLKLWHHDSRTINLILVGLLIVSGVCLAGVILGFFQLAFTF